MRKHLPLAAALLMPFAMCAQTTLFSENFNSSINAFTMNTTDMGSVASGSNSWVVNNSYAGGSGSLVCMSFTLNFTVPSTAQQPAQITGNPTSNYMHILSSEAAADGITNGCYQAADGFCYFAENYFTKMSSDISTVGYTNTTLSFWWLCGGSANAFGETYYSTDGGLTWTAISGQYQNVSNAWQQQTITNAAFDNKPTLRFGFRFTNQTTTAAADPGFCIDDILVTGQLSTGIASSVNAQAFTAFPNPATDVLHLNCDMNAAQDDQLLVTVTDITGAVVRRETRSYAARVDISTAELVAGAYFLTVECGGNRSTIRFAVTD